VGERNAAILFGPPPARAMFPVRCQLIWSASLWPWKLSRCRATLLSGLHEAGCPLRRGRTVNICWVFPASRLFHSTELRCSMPHRWLHQPGRLFWPGPQTSATARHGPRLCLFWPTVAFKDLPLWPFTSGDPRLRGLADVRWSRFFRWARKQQALPCPRLLVVVVDSLNAQVESAFTVLAILSMTLGNVVARSDFDERNAGLELVSVQGRLRENRAGPVEPEGRLSPPWLLYLGPPSVSMNLGRLRLHHPLFSLRNRAVIAISGLAGLYQERIS